MIDIVFDSEPDIDCMGRIEVDGKIYYLPAYAVELLERAWSAADLDLDEDEEPEDD